MSGDVGVIDGSWEDTEGNGITITGEKVLGPAGIQLDIVFESADTCLMQMGDEIYEGKLSSDGRRVEWSDGEIWTRRCDPADVVNPKSLTLQQALSMQEELREGFACGEFQKRLTELSKSYPSAGVKYVAARNELFLEVQGTVLPRYGFAGTPQGVVEMLKAAARWNNNIQFRNNREELNKLLGLGLDEAREKDGNAQTDAATFLLRNSRADHATAHQSSLFPMQLNITDARSCAYSKINSKKQSKSSSRRQNNKDSDEDDAEIVEKPRRIPFRSPPCKSVEINVREALGDNAIKVSVSENATFYELKEAISRHVGRDDILKRGHLVRHHDGTWAPFTNAAVVGDVREVLVLRASLAVYDDTQAKWWRQELEKNIRGRQMKHEEALAAAKRRQDELAQCAIHIATTTHDSQNLPYGDCYIVGTWDDFTERHKMAWDGASYRIGMNLQGMGEVSFQIIAHDSWDSRIYPSTSNAGPTVPHTIMGPDARKVQNYWTLHVEDCPGNDAETAYEIALHCPSGRPMLLQWDRVSLDSMSWYPTADDA